MWTYFTLHVLFCFYLTGGYYVFLAVEIHNIQPEIMGVEMLLMVSAVREA